LLRPVCKKRLQEKIAKIIISIFFILGTPVPRGVFGQISRQTVTREVFAANTSSQSSEWELDMLRANLSGPGDANTAWIQVFYPLSFNKNKCMNALGFSVKKCRESSECVYKIRVARLHVLAIFISLQKLVMLYSPSPSFRLPPSPPPFFPTQTRVCKVYFVISNVL
jgi:hypothetical protein